MYVCLYTYFVCIRVWYIVAAGVVDREPLRKKVSFKFDLKCQVAGTPSTTHAHKNKPAWTHILAGLHFAGQGKLGQQMSAITGTDLDITCVADADSDGDGGLQKPDKIVVARKPEEPADIEMVRNAECPELDPKGQQRMAKKARKEAVSVKNIE